MLWHRLGGGGVVVCADREWKTSWKVGGIWISGDVFGTRIGGFGGGRENGLGDWIVRHGGYRKRFRGLFCRIRTTGHRHIRLRLATFNLANNLIINQLHKNIKHTSTTPCCAVIILVLLKQRAPVFAHRGSFSAIRYFLSRYVGRQTYSFQQRRRYLSKRCRRNGYPLTNMFRREARSSRRRGGRTWVEGPRMARWIMLEGGLWAGGDLACSANNRKRIGRDRTRQDEGEGRISTIQIEKQLRRLLRNHSPLLPKKSIRNHNKPDNTPPVASQRQLGRKPSMQEITIG